MKYLVDAFNVIHAEPRLKRLLEDEGPAPACRALVGLLTAWLSIPRKRRASIVVVADGARPLDGGRPGRGPAPGLTVVYMHDEADAELMRRLRTGRGHVLVSADREIRNVAEASGSESVAPRTFLRAVWEELEDEREHAQRHGAVAPTEVDAWARLFGGEKAVASPPPPPSAPSATERRPAPPPARPTPAPPAEGRREGGLSKDEVKAWLAYFDRPPEEPPGGRRRR